ncbi:phosphatidylinositol 3,4,5-trisphosphate 5-phosphatase 2-like isoform X2 [Hydractinia symbiolongicarpus]|uniref:phosphatidylinositol 3,4,5-trisphosphate 5-phosphatase 2-like isoform X2 n=1 Tax=Hydractinia symbiolongicarpus TaxID=13093 RepID=UPI002551278A|nr:phosphatidylinositol 3,4,5-trisphosphate 5-phosphatase 2-like isoform X2 [Hydractinia symbiolongicarpus]
MEKMTWYHPFMSRLECEKILQHKKDGSFLIRNSESTVSDQVLSICWDSCAHHYKIKRSDKGMFLAAAKGVEQFYFNTLDKLVSYYQYPDRGLPYVLTEPISRDSFSGNDDDVDSDFSESDDEADSITLFFQQQLDIIKGLKLDTVLKESLQEYVTKGINKDFQRVQSGSNKPPMLQKLLVEAAGDLQLSLQKFLTRLGHIHELFDVGSNVQALEQYEHINQDNNSKDLESVFKMLSECKSGMLRLEQKACKVLKEYSGLSTSQNEQKPSNTEMEYSVLSYDTKGSPTVIAEKPKDVKHKLFEVTSGPLKSKSYIALDITNGKIIFLKNNQDKLESGTAFTSEQVFQLVKSKTSKSKLGILLENMNVKNYYFENFRSRELFCQVVQQIKIAHSKDIHSSELSVFVGSWNMGDAVEGDISEWFKCLGLGKTRPQEFCHIASDIYAIGTQESAYHEKEWVKKIQTCLKSVFRKEFKLLTCYSMWDIRIVIFVKSELLNLVNSVKQSSVKTGIATVLGNKGAVGVSFNVGTTSFCFVNCHLTSGNEKLQRRNQNFHSILRGLNLGQRDSFDLMLSFHHLFWFGDLNYRLDLDVTDIIKWIMEREWQKLLAADQLIAEIRKGNAFISFEEEDISFPPTYRYTRGTRSTYCWTKEKRTGTRINVPSWCDRVLWKSYPELTSCNTTYGCTESICSSDHSPVFATFDVGVLSQTLAASSHEDHTDSGMIKALKIVFFSAEAKILTSSGTKFMLEFHSNCLEKRVITKKNSYTNCRRQTDSLFRGSIPSDHKTYSYPWWTKTDLVDLHPVLSDLCYLEDQHLLVAVKGEDGQEYYGECVISMKMFLSGNPKVFEVMITHLGVETGVLKVEAQLIIPSTIEYTASQKSKVYDLIKVEEEDSRPNTKKCGEKKEMYLVNLPVKKEDIDQIDPVDKKVEPPTDNEERPISMGFDNPCVKYTKLDDSTDELPALPPKKKTLSLPNSLPDNSTMPPLLMKSGERNASEELKPLLSNTLPRSCPVEDLQPPSNTGQILTSEAELLLPSSSEMFVPVPKPRTKKMVKQFVSDFSKWLNNIGFEMYAEHLINNGFDDLDYFCSITEEDLKDVGILDEKHREKIVLEAKKLKGRHKDHKDIVAV